jgi:hypothetical protein
MRIPTELSRKANIFITLSIAIPIALLVAAAIRNSTTPEYRERARIEAQKEAESKAQEAKKKQDEEASKKAAAEKPKPKATFTASLGKYWALDPATLVVVVNVKNTGAASGIPQCYIQASSPSGAYKGFDVFTPNKLAPGEETSFNANLTITKEGAAYVTEGSVDCNN